MGGGSSKDKIQKIDRNEWQQIHYHEGVEIVRSNKGRGLGQIRAIPLDPKLDIDKELEIYHSRKIQNEPLVKCYGAEGLEGKSSGICGNDQNVRVLTERIPKRWSELPQLTFPETIYALNESLRGYHELYKNAGLFQVNQDMLGINNDGHIKVWSNENFAENHPSYEKNLLQTTAENDVQVSSQKEMVKDVISVIEERCEEGRYPQDFRQKIYNCNSFVSAEDETERYAKQKNLFVSNLIHPNTDVIVSKVVQQVPIYGEQRLQSEIPMEMITSQAYSQSVVPLKSNPQQVNLQHTSYAPLQSQPPIQQVSQTQFITPITTISQNQVEQPTYSSNMKLQSSVPLTTLQKPQVCVFNVQPQPIIYQKALDPIGYVPPSRQTKMNTYPLQVTPNLTQTVHVPPKGVDMCVYPLESNPITETVYVPPKLNEVRTYTSQVPEQKLYTTTATTNHVRAPSVIAQKVYVPQITQASNVNYETRPAQTVNTVRTTQFQSPQRYTTVNSARKVSNVKFTYESPEKRQYK